MSPLDPETPPVGEEVHLPGPSLLPLLTAVGITLALVGITTMIELTVVGVILTVWSRSHSDAGSASSIAHVPKPGDTRFARIPVSASTFRSLRP